MGFYLHFFRELGGGVSVFGVAYIFPAHVTIIANIIDDIVDSCGYY